MSNDDVIISWIRKAENDLKNAEIVIKSDSPPLDTICFHCQQCAEKYIKALLVYYEKEPPKTHIIEDLIQKLEDKAPELNDIIDEADELSDYAIGSRYPEEIFEISMENSTEALAVANKIKNIVLSKLPDHIKQQLGNG